MVYLDGGRPFILVRIAFFPRCAFPLSIVGRFGKVADLVTYRYRLLNVVSNAYCGPSMRGS